MTMTPLEVLKAARALIDSPEKWCQGAHARDRFGNRCDPSSPIATRFCSRGAILLACGGDYELKLGAIEALLPFAGGRNIVYFNDAPDRTHPEVLAAFDKAIASLEAA